MRKILRSVVESDIKVGAKFIDKINNPVEVLATDLSGSHNILVVITRTEPIAVTYDKHTVESLRFNCRVEVEEPEYWVNIYRSNNASEALWVSNHYSSEEIAKRNNVGYNSTYLKTVCLNDLI